MISDQPTDLQSAGHVVTQHMNKQTNKQIRICLTIPRSAATRDRGGKIASRAALVMPAHTLGRNNTAIEKYSEPKHFGVV
jgi:hypothetical protein